MKTFKKTAAQGDVYFERIDKLPEGAVEVPPEGDYVIVAHSETGHHHVMDRAKTKMYRLPEEIYECFLVVEEQDVLEHQREEHTHESIQFEPGVYRVNNQREQSLGNERITRAVAD